MSFEKNLINLVYHGIYITIIVVATDFLVDRQAKRQTERFIDRLGQILSEARKREEINTIKNDVDSNP